MSTQALKEAPDLNACETGGRSIVTDRVDMPPPRSLRQSEADN
jgi:hypothetical protein